MTGETPPATKGVTEALRKSLERLLLEFDFLVEDGTLPDIRNDVIFVDAREALSTSSSGGLAVKALRDGLTAVRPVIEALIRQEYNVKTWGLHSRLAAIDAALSSLDRTTLPAAEGWETIDGAPKDGSKFLAYEKGRYFDCWWHENAHGEAYWMDEADSEPNPSHWRDLPAAPQGSR